MYSNSAAQFVTVTVAAVAVLLPALLTAQPKNGALADCPIAGQNLTNSWDQPAEHQISTANVSHLAPKWIFTTGGDVSATPTVGGGAVYFPDWAGNLFAVSAKTGKQIWSRMISTYNNQAGSMSRVSPAIFQNELIIGDNVIHSVAHNGAHVMAVDRNSGQLLWITQVDSHPAAIITGSPVFNGNIVYVGVSSVEEGLATNPNYPCCTFRGSIVALNAFTGAIVWKTFTVPDNGGQTGGYSGGAVWQPPAIDPTRGLLYIGTGNNYTVPDSVLNCEKNSPEASCTAPDDHFETALALDLNTGAVKWATGVSKFDAWTVACLSSPTATNCPQPSGPDFDLGGSGPNLIGNIIGFGQKGGIYWAMNADNGNIIWATQVGPGSVLGGIEWGTATDGTRIYAAITNFNHVSYQLQPNGPTVTSGSWAALDVKTGKFIWQIADPRASIDPQHAIDMGSLSVANGVLYAPSFTGFVYGIDAATGKVLFQFDTGGSVIDGPSIAGGTVYWGSGYRHIAPLGIGNNKVFALSLSDQ